MTFAEMRANFDQFNEFSSWDTIESFVASGKISKDFAFPEKCAECGSDIIIKDTFTQIMCCNPNCRKKVSYRLAKLIENLGYKGIGEAGASSLLYAAEKAMGHELESFLDVFCVDDVDWGGTAIGESALLANFKGIRDDLKNRRFTFAEVFSKLAIPGFGSESASKFRDITSVSDFMDKITTDGVVVFLSKHGIYNDKAANQIYQNLHHIYAIERAFPNDLREAGKISVPVCITGNITLYGRAIVKADFIRMVNEAEEFTINGRQIYEVSMNSAVSSNPFVICSAPSNSSKYRIASGRGSVTDAFGTHSVLVTPEMFVETLLRGREEILSKMRENGLSYDSIDDSYRSIVIENPVIGKVVYFDDDSELGDYYE